MFKYMALKKHKKKLVAHASLHFLACLPEFCNSSAAVGCFSPAGHQDFGGVPPLTVRQARRNSRRPGHVPERIDTGA